ncbi:hypothetical protein B0T16DRAFT_384671 [Cercophora newfieldiana]|uniref:Uncharacterized protein n=1 Tax=Cercophora newfieldiana TaxID=92897 RepID=A0AA39YNL7_9PEZI|nr:hypothetical protein B0T16DRAFT_384671 [Cercophora newfieldiana]
MSSHSDNSETRMPSEGAIELDNLSGPSKPSENIATAMSMTDANASSSKMSSSANHPAEGTSGHSTKRQIDELSETEEPAPKKQFREELEVASQKEGSEVASQKEDPENASRKEGSGLPDYESEGLDMDISSTHSEAASPEEDSYLADDEANGLGMDVTSTHLDTDANVTPAVNSSVHIAHDAHSRSLDEGQPAPLGPANVQYVQLPNGNLRAIVEFPTFRALPVVAPVAAIAQRVQRRPAAAVFLNREDDHRNVEVIVIDD